MTRLFLASIAVVSALAEVPYAQEAQKKGALPKSNQVYVKIILPVDPSTRAKDPPVVESWIAEELKKRGQSKFSAVTAWVPIVVTGERIEFPTHVWSGGLDGKAWGCPVSGEIAERADGRIKIHLDGWAPVPGRGVTVSLTDEPGSRAIAANKKYKSEEGMPYVAVVIGPPLEQKAKGKIDRTTAEAWKKDGAEVGWIGIDVRGFLQFGTTSDGLQESLPALRLGRWQENVLNKLPDPAVPFGLCLANTKVTDRGLKELAGLKSLHTLNLFDTTVTDAGLKEISGLKSVIQLRLRGTQVTDAGLKELARMKNLQLIDLGFTKVTDAGLKELEGLKSLRTLDVGFTKVTDRGVAALRKALPDCFIRS